MARPSDDPTPPAPRPSEPDSAGSGGVADPTRVVGGRYEILGLVGTGGMGAVYGVKDRALGEIVALKALLPGFANGTEAHARFRREVRLARRVTHKNVARTYDLGEAFQEPMQDPDVCPTSAQGRIDREQSFATASTIGLVAGGIALATGVVLLVALGRSKSARVTPPATGLAARF